MLGIVAESQYCPGMPAQRSPQSGDIGRAVTIILMGKRDEFAPGRGQRKVPVRGDAETLWIDVQRQCKSFRRGLEFADGVEVASKISLPGSALGAQRLDQDRQIRRRPVHWNGKCMVHGASVMPDGHIRAQSRQVTLQWGHAETRRVDHRR